MHFIMFYFIFNQTDNICKKHLLTDNVVYDIGLLSKEYRAVV